MQLGLNKGLLKVSVLSVRQEPQPRPHGLLPQRKRTQ